MTTTSFVFHDPSGKRWTRIRRAAQIGGLALAGLAALLGIALVTNPSLPSVALASVAEMGDRAEIRGIIGKERAAKNVPFAAHKTPIQYVKSASPVIHQKTAARERSDQPLVFGYYVNWDPFITAQ